VRFVSTGPKGPGPDPGIAGPSSERGRGIQSDTSGIRDHTNHMQFVYNTNTSLPHVLPTGDSWSFREALFMGQAPDGGLFLPESLPTLPVECLRPGERLPFAERALVVARHLLGDDVADDVLQRVVLGGLNFPVPLSSLEPGVRMLELFHGPTYAFKDVGACFMARMMSELRGDGSEVGNSGDVTVLTATSGDTGAAVARAFAGIPGVRVVIFYPRGGVSVRQEAQFATVGGNVEAVGVEGSFDDCQTLVRTAFADRMLCTAHGLTSANSINVGRLLPQLFYYAHGWAEAELEAGAGPSDPRELVVSVPSGNFGNLAAGLMARAIGVPITSFVAATNANSVVPDYLATGVYRPRSSAATISNAMDVGDPSNLRRIRSLFGDDLDDLRAVVSSSSWSDEETRACIRETWRDRGVLIDPHTAVGLLGLRQALARRPGARGIVLGTAHPAKFAEVVEPLIGQSVPVPGGLARAMTLPRRTVVIEPSIDALRKLLAGG